MIIELKKCHDNEEEYALSRLRESPLRLHNSLILQNALEPKTNESERDS
jgi:hypothetical protein